MKQLLALLLHDYHAHGFKERQRRAPFLELIHRLENCQVCLLNAHRLQRRQSRLDLWFTAVLQAPGSIRKNRMRVRRRNRAFKRTTQQSFVFVEAFYWNASRAIDCAVALQLMTNREASRLDAIRVRHKLMEHQEPLEPPSLIYDWRDGGPSLKPFAELPQPLTDLGLFDHAIALAAVLERKIRAALTDGA